MGVPDYIRDPAEIYRQSFETVRAEADYSHLPAAMHDVATRIIHACGMVDSAKDLLASENAVEAGMSALQSGCSIFTDVEMVRAGIIDKFLPAEQ